VVPKSGDVAGKIVQVGITHVLTKMGLMGIQLRIATRANLPQEFRLGEEAPAVPPAPAAAEAAEKVVETAGVESSGQA
jgi:small subunit ribosomal protein S3